MGTFEEKRLTPEQRKLAVAGLISFFLVGAAGLINGPLGLALTPTYQRPETDGAQLATAFFVGSALVILAAASTQGVFSKRWVVRGGLVLYLAGAGIAGTAQSWESALIGIGLLGCANGAFGTWFNAEVARGFRGLWLSILNGFWAIGAISGPLLLRAFLSDPKMAHLTLGAMALLLSPFIWNVAGLEGSSLSTASKGSRVPVPMRVYGIGVLMALYVGSETSVFVFSPPHVKAIHGFDVARAAELSALLMLAFTLGRFFLGAVSSRFRPSISLTALALLIIAGALGTSLAGGAYAGYLLVGLAMGPIFPILVQWVVKVAPDPHRATAVITSGGVLAAAISPSVVTPLQAQSMANLPWIYGCGFLVMAIVSLGIDAKLRKSP